MKQEKEFLSVEEVADLLGVHYQLVYKLVRSGDLPSARVGRVYRVIRKDLDAYLEKSKKESVTGGVCAACGKSYSAATSIKEACRECGAPLCVDCWTRKKIHVCAEHATAKREKTR